METSYLNGNTSLYSGNHVQSNQHKNETRKKNDILNEHNTRTERNAMGNIEEENQIDRERINE